MWRALRVGGLLAAVAVTSAIIILLGAEDNPLEASVSLRDFLRDCDWRQILR